MTVKDIERNIHVFWQREREREREREKKVFRWGKERDRLNLLHKDKLIIQRKSDISSSSTKNGKY
jgi:hypothetical protein